MRRSAAIQPKNTMKVCLPIRGTHISDPEKTVRLSRARLVLQPQRTLTILDALDISANLPSLKKVEFKGTRKKTIWTMTKDRMPNGIHALTFRTEALKLFLDDVPTGRASGTIDIEERSGLKMKQLPYTRTFCISASILVSWLAVFNSSANAEEIRIGGTGNALGTMRLMGGAFTAKYPATKVTVLGSIGSSGAIKAVPKGVIDIGLSSRPLSEEERADGIVTAEYARTLTVLAISSKAKATEITNVEIAKIFDGTLATWSDGTRVRPVLRQPGDDNTKQIKALSPEIEKAMIAAEKREGLAFAVTDQEAADKIESIPGAVGTSTLALIKSEGRALRALKLDGVEPSENRYASGAYPASLVKHFYFVTQKEPSAAVQQFIAYVASPDGQDVLTKNGQWRP